MEQAGKKGIDSGLTYINESNLARKADICQFPENKRLHLASGQNYEKSQTSIQRNSIDQRAAGTEADVQMQNSRTEYRHNYAMQEGQTQRRQSRVMQEGRTERRQSRAMQEEQTQRRQSRAMQEEQTQRRQSRAMQEGRTERRQSRAMQEGQTQRRQSRAMQEGQTQRRPGRAMQEGPSARRPGYVQQEGYSEGRRQTTAVLEESRRRNPYLANYGTQTFHAASLPGTHNQKKEMGDIDLIWGEEVLPPAGRTQQREGAASRYEEMVPKRKSRNTETQLRHSTAKTAVNAGKTAVHKQHGAIRETGRQAQERTAEIRRPAVQNRARRPVTENQRRQMQAIRRKEILRRKLIIGIVEAVVLIFVVVLLFLAFREPKVKEPEIPVFNQEEENEEQQKTTEQKVQGFAKDVFDTHPAWTEDFLTISEYSRPGEPLLEVKNIFVHYTANPNTSAKQNRSYFEQLKDTHERGASAHFIIGYNGEIIQCVPLDEIAYAVQTRNEDSISIECCFKNKDGSFTQETYDSLISLLAWLTDVYGLDSEDILRHYDCGGKKCPLYYTEHEDAWKILKSDVKNYKL